MSDVYITYTHASESLACSRVYMLLSTPPLNNIGLKLPLQIDKIFRSRVAVEVLCIIVPLVMRHIRENNLLGRLRRSNSSNGRARRRNGRQGLANGAVRQTTAKHVECRGG